MNYVSFALIALGCGALAGCGGGGDFEDCTPTSCSFSGPASVTVGGGISATGFVPMNDGDEMEIILGPQGLYMITPSIRVTNMYPGDSGGKACDPEVSLALYLDSEAIGGSAREQVGLRATADGGEGLGIFAPFTGRGEAEGVDDFLGQSIAVRAEISDACGRSASDELTVLTVFGGS